MPKFPIDAPISRVIKALEGLGFQSMRQGNHISMVRDNAVHRSRYRIDQRLDAPNHTDAVGHSQRRFLAGLREGVEGPSHECCSVGNEKGSKSKRGQIFVFLSVVVVSLWFVRARGVGPRLGRSTESVLALLHCLPHNFRPTVGMSTTKHAAISR